MRHIWIFLFTAALLSATPVSTVKLTSPGDPNNVILGNIYVSPYGMQINGQTYAAMCIDYPDESYLNKPWQAYVTPLSGGNFSNTYHGADSNAAQEYEEEAYLYGQMTTLSVTDPNYSTERTDIQEAAWVITDPGYTPSDPNGAQSWLTLAQNNYGSVNLANFEIVSDTNAGSGRNQEFIIDTPEPDSLALLATGFLFAGVGVFGKRFAKSRRVPKN